MIKSFNQYINENNQGFDRDASNYCRDVINIVKNFNSPGDDYIEIRKLEYKKPDFDLVIQIKKSDSPDFESDSHFKTLPWEEINYQHYGFAIDANTIIDRGDLMLPEIVVTLIINPRMEPKLYKELEFRLTDILVHEINHTLQVGWNREPFKVRPSSHIDRQLAKKSYQYFLLPDEIESMVKGAYNRSKKQSVPIDKIFDKYLYPFMMAGRMTNEQYLQVLKAWVNHALENYPDSDFSTEDEKISSIINKI